MNHCSNTQYFHHHPNTTTSDFIWVRFISIHLLQSSVINPVIFVNYKEAGNFPKYRLTPKVLYLLFIGSSTRLHNMVGCFIKSPICSLAHDEHYLKIS